MRPTFLHVLTGLLLGTALAGLLNVPGQVVAQQESIPPVRSPHVAKPKREPVVRVSPAAERPPVTKKAKPPKPQVVFRPVLVRMFVPSPQPVAPQAPPKRAAKPTPKPRPTPAPPPATPPPPPKTVLSQPPPPPPPPPDDDEEEDDDHDDDDGGHDDDDDDDDGGHDDDDDDRGDDDDD